MKGYRKFGIFVLFLGIYYTSHVQYYLRISFAIRVEKKTNNIFKLNIGSSINIYCIYVKLQGGL